MHFLLHHWLAILFVVCGSLFLSVGLWVFSIYYSVKNAPREDMFYCPKHGMLKADSTIKFMDSVEVVDMEDAHGRPIKSHISHGERYCPLCFSDKLGGRLPG